MPHAWRHSVPAVESSDEVRSLRRDLGTRLLHLARCLCVRPPPNRHGGCALFGRVLCGGLLFTPVPIRHIDKSASVHKWLSDEMNRLRPLAAAASRWLVSHPVLVGRRG